MKVAISFLAFFLLSNLTTAQWYWQNPLPQGNTLNGVKFISPTVGWAVGDYGTILKTTNGGTIWLSQISGTIKDPMPEPLSDVSFTDANNGTAVGSIFGTILRTTNGGTNWTSYISGFPIFGVSFTDSNNGTTVGYNGRILRTTDGGITWILQTSGTTNSLTGVSFTDANTGTVIGGNGTILRTTNGGTTWTSQSSGTTIYLNGISFTDSNTGTVVGGNGTILRTTNGGTTWTAQTSGTTNSLSDVSFIDVNTGMAVGYYGTILRTTNGGSTWTAQTSGTTTWFNSVYFTDLNTGWAVGGGFPGTIHKTINGGTTWIQQISGTAQTLTDVSFTDANTGTVVGSNGVIRRTTTGGANWFSQTSGTTNSLTGVSFTDANTGTVIGGNGTILRTTNGGTTWTSQSSGTTIYLNGISFTDSNTGTVVGDNGTILRTTNGGINWIQQSSGTINNLYGVSFTDANNGTAVGVGETILRTTNGGTAWTLQISGPMILYSVSFTDTNTGTAVGLNGRILRTTDGGITWISQTSGTANSLQSVSFVDANNGTAVGNGGTILKTINGGLTLLPLILICPNNGSFLLNDLTPDLSWQQYTNANYFHIQVDNDSTFSSLVAEELSWPTLNYTPTLPSLGTYYWRVRAHTIDNNWSQWSEVWSFTISDAKIVVDSIAVSSGGQFVSYLPNNAPINVGDKVRMKCRILTPTNTPIPNAIVDVLDQTIYNVEIGDSGIVSTVSNSTGEFYYPDDDGYVQPYSGLVSLVFNPKGTENLTPLILRVFSDSLLIDNINDHMRDQLQLAHLQGISTEFDSIYFFYDEENPLNVTITAVGDSMSYSRATLENFRQRGVINDFIEEVGSALSVQSVLPSPFSILMEGGFESYLERRRQFVENLPRYLKANKRILSAFSNFYERDLPVVRYTLGGQKFWMLTPVVINFAEEGTDILLQRYQNIICPSNITPGCQEMCTEWLQVLKSATFFVAEEIAASPLKLGRKFYKNLGLFKKLYSYATEREEYIGYLELLNSGLSSIVQSTECITNSYNELRGVKISSYTSNNQYSQLDSVYGPAIYMTLIDAVQFSEGVEFNIIGNKPRFSETLEQDTIDVLIQTPTQCFTNDGNPTLPTVTLNSFSPIEVLDLGYNPIAGKYEYEAKFALTLAIGSTYTIYISGQDLVGNLINYTSYFEWGTSIPPTGGTINLQNGLSISVPSGGFLDSAQVSLIPVTSIYANKSNHFIYAALLDASSEFVLPAQLSLPFGKQDSVLAENFKMYKLDEQNQAWINIPNSVINYQDKLITAPISASGIYAVGDTTNIINIVFTPAEVVFDSTLPGMTQDKLVTIINSVNSTMQLIAETTEPNDPFSFVGSGGPFTLSPGMSKQIIVRFSPANYDSSFDKIVISHNAPGSVDTIPLYGVSLLPGMTLRNVSLNPNWNLLSLPVDVLDGNPITLFPSAISQAYGYSGSYFAEDTLKSVVGYWLKFPSVQTIELAGYPLVAETIAVASGWNIIGSISYPIATANITSIPGGLITSQFFGYGTSGYANSDSIHTGKGYWVKLSQAGQLVLSSEGTATENERIKIVLTNEMPPAPPDITEVEDLPLPTIFAIEQNYPNPFNPSTVIRFSVPKEVQVNISLYNILGERVKELKNELMKPGYYQVEFNATSLTTGVYFYRIIAGDFVETKKMVLIK